MVSDAWVRALHMKRVGIVAALPGELTPLVRGWQQRGRNLWMGSLGDVQAVAVAGGMGSAAAERAVGRVFGEGTPDALISYGWAGALTCAVKPQTACAISEVVDAKSGERFVTADTGGYRLITLDRVARGDEKRELAARYQSVLVDMEAAAVARVAAAQGLPFHCYKGISDGSNDNLPDFGRFIDENGELRMTAFLAYVAARPKCWPSLQRLGVNSKAAALALADLMEKHLTRPL